MEYIERPKEVNKSEAGVQSSEYIQKNMQGQLNNIYDYLDNLVDNKEEYSTDEIRIGTWIDGSAIYRAIIPCNLGNLSTSWQNLVQVPNNLKQLINLRGVRNFTNDAQNLILPVYNSSSYFVQFRISNLYIQVQGTGYDNMNIYLIIDYTKGG